MTCLKTESDPLRRRWGAVLMAELIHLLTASDIPPALDVHLLTASGSSSCTSSTSTSSRPVSANMQSNQDEQLKKQQHYLPWWSTSRWAAELVSEETTGRSDVEEAVLRVQDQRKKWANAADKVCM